MLPALFGALLAPAKAMNISVDGARIGYAMLLKNFGFALVPLVLTLATLWATWWYVVIHQQPDIRRRRRGIDRSRRLDDAPQPLGAGAAPQPAEEKLEELGARQRPAPRRRNEPEALQQMGSAELREQTTAAPSEAGPPPEFYTLLRVHRRPSSALLLLYYYWKHGGRAVRGPAAADLLGDAARHPHRGRAGRDPVRHHHGDGIGRGRRGRRLPARVPGADAGLEAHQGSGVPHRQDHRDGVLAVRRLGAVLGGVRASSAARRWSRAGCCRST